MKVKIHLNTLKLRNKFKINHGSYDVRHQLLIELCQGNESGFGETVAIDYYGQDISEMRLKAESIVDKLEKLDVSITVESFYKLLLEYLPTDPFVRCAFDEAFIDLKSRLSNMSIRAFLGIENTKETLSSVTIGLGDSQELIDKLVSDNWPFYKIKIKDNIRRDIINKMNLNSRKWGVDANGGVEVANAQMLINELEKAGCTYAEQLLSKTNVKKLNQLVTSEMMMHFADESVSTLSDLKKLESIYNGFVLKLTKCGGITPVLKMIKYCKLIDKKVLLGCMTESSIGINHAYALLPLVDFADLDGAYLLSNDDEVCKVDYKPKKKLTTSGKFE